MPRSYAAFFIFGLLTLVLVIGVYSRTTVSGQPPGSESFEPMVHAKNGQLLTLELVQKDVVWHRETLRKLRELD